MKELVGAVVLLDRASGKFVPAEVYRDVDSKNLDDFENLWKPILRSRRAEFQSWKDAADADAQDAHWDWLEKATIAARSLGNETFAVECDGKTQGLMLVDLTRFARSVGQEGRDLAYIELLATAPWNRKRLVAAPAYGGVGHVLIGTAISFSFDLGFKGRLGLHSLPQSESWYRDRAGFTDLGPDAAVKKMNYFEMTETQAAAFIADDVKVKS